MKHALLLLVCLLAMLSGSLVAGIEDESHPPPAVPELSGPNDPPGSAGADLTADEVLARILKRVETETAMRREFEETHAYVVEKITERRDAANQLRERKVEREEHDPREEPVGDDDQGPGYRQKDFKVDQELLDRYRITLARVEAVHGRPAWALEFEPTDPPRPAKGVKERFLNQIAGTVWVDQAECTMARLEMRLVEPVHVIGGLVGAVKACQVFLQRERAPSGLWYNATMRWRLEGRKLLVTTVMIHEERRSEVRRVLDSPTGKPGPETTETAELKHP
jgi:hypothetical protein